MGVLSCLPSKYSLDSCVARLAVLSISRSLEQHTSKGFHIFVPLHSSEWNSATFSVLSDGVVCVTLSKSSCQMLGK